MFRILWIEAIVYLQHLAHLKGALSMRCRLITEKQLRHGSLERVFFGERDPGNAPERGFAFNSGDVAFNRFSGAHALRDDCIQKLLEGKQ